jgi:aspartate aminotransferase
MAFPPHLGPLQASIPFLRWFESSRYSKRAGDPAIADLVFGNPHEMPMPEYVAVLQKHLTPQDKDWVAYKMNTEPATRAVAASLQRRTGLAFEHQDVFLTTGGFAAIAVSLRTVAGPGDEVIFLSPPWFFYEMLIGAAGATAVRVQLAAPHFELDPNTIEAAITERTRAVIVNSPHNPTGRVYGSGELRALAATLTRASKRIGHDIALLSDEAYVRIAFDGLQPESPARYYPHTFVLYS